VLKIAALESIYKNPSVNLAMVVACVNGRTGEGTGAGGRRVQTGCGQRGRHGACLSAGGQATIKRSKIVAC